MKRISLVILAVLLAVGGLMVAGCKGDRIMISKILERPDYYRDRDVVVAGRVTETHAVNLFIAEAGAYQLDDGSGKIWVITKTGVPERGDELGVKGRVDGGVKLFGESFGSVIRETERRRN